MRILFSATFIRRLGELDDDLQDEVAEKVALFKDPRNYKRLRVHKLHGRFANKWSFSVNFKIRIIFEKLDQATVALLTIGDHDVYR